MNTFTKKSLHVALAGLGTLGLAGAADAVMVNPNGLGQVLIYPYYTVRSPAGAGIASYNTLLSIVNTTSSTKAVKVRFREGKASAEVLDFNVFLSPRDVWTAAVTPLGGGDQVSGTPPLPGAQIETSDRSCTIPNFVPNVPVLFRSGAYEGDAVKDNSLDRLMEGYFEVFEMAVYDNTSVIGINAKHSKGVPADCSKVTNASAQLGILPPEGGLFGGATLINVLTGDAFTEDATALVQFTDTGAYSDTGIANPNFSNASPAIGAAVSEVGSIVSGAFLVTGVPTHDVLLPEKAVTLALQKQTVLNEFVGEAATLSGTDWVVTFPTKHHFVTANLAVAPFATKLSAAGSCDNVSLDTWDREETPVTPGGPDFSPSPSPAGFALCWEANIVSFKAISIPGGSGIANVLGSGNAYTVGTGFNSGWARLTFDKTTARLVPDVANGIQHLEHSPGCHGYFWILRSIGLPTVGFAVQTFVNGTLSDSQGRFVQSSYGGNFGHRYTGPQAGVPVVPLAP